MSKISPAGISFFLWLLLRSPTAKVSAISKPVCVPSNPSFITWASGAKSLNTLAHANEHRDWRIYAEFAQILIATAGDLYRDEPFGVELSETVNALDSTTIDLCLALFPWEKFRRHKSAVKLHTLLDLRAT